MVPYEFFRIPRLTSAAVAFVGLVALAIMPGACTKVPLVAPSGTVITLISTTNQLPLNGAADIVAILIENGTVTTTPTTPGGGNNNTTTASAGTAVHNGTVVSFTTTLGRIEPAEAKTSGGQVTVKLVADGRSGVATITAYSGGATKQLTLNVGAAAAARILVTATPQTLPATGGSATIIATVQDQQSNPISGVPVTFSTSAGSLSVTSGITDAYGNTTSVLTTAAAATVTASTGGGTTGTLSGTVALTILPNSTVTITPPSGTVTVSTPMSFTVGVGTSVIAKDVLIDFGDGETFDLGPVSQTQTVPHIYGNFGSYTAKATAIFVDGTTKTVSTPVIVGDYTITAGCSGNVAFGGTSTFTATVTPTGMSLSDFIWSFGTEGVQHGSSVTHTFQSRGTKIVTLTVIPSKGPAKSASCSLEVT